MKQMVQKALATGYGLGLLSVDQAKKIADSVKKELHFDDEQSRKLAKELAANSEKMSRDVFRTADKYFGEALVRSGVMTKHEVAGMRTMLKRNVQKLKPGKKSMWDRLRKK